MKHTDELKIAATDWDAVLGLLPPTVQESFASARKARAERSMRLLEMAANSDGGLTTWDPAFRGWIDAESRILESIGDMIERAECHSRERRLGVVEAARSFVSV